MKWKLPKTPMRAFLTSQKNTLHNAQRPKIEFSNPSLIVSGISFGSFSPLCETFREASRGRRSPGSAIGSPKRISELLVLAAEEGIQPSVEERQMKDANQAVLDMNEGNPRFRYVFFNDESVLNRFVLSVLHRKHGRKFSLNTRLALLLQSCVLLFDRSLISPFLCPSRSALLSSTGMLG